MIKYFCDGCGEEITDDDRKKYGFTINNAHGIALDELDLCDSCNKLIWDTIKIHTSKRGS